jgi:N-acetyl-anhydromuramyl-L-alanine amidase AmpD
MNYKEKYKTDGNMNNETSVWSKEDINMIDWLIRCCEEEHKELCNDKYGHQDIVSDLKRDCRKKWDWLESLKNKVAPQNTWKPSDEQMDALWFYAEQNNHAGAVLTSLYNDLKKLKEGRV